MKARATVAVLLAMVSSTACARGISVASFEIDGHPSAVTTVGSRVWVTDDVNHVVHVLDADTGSAVGDAVAVSKNPIAVAAGAGAVWVGHADGRLTALDARTHEIRDVEKVGSQITGLAFALGRVWASDFAQGELVGIDPDDLDVTDEIEIDGGAVRVGAGPGRTLWVTNAEDTVTRISGGAVDGVRDVGPGPIGLASDGDVVWVANSDANSVTPLRGEDGEPGEAVPVGRGPIGVAAFEGDAWAANQDDATLTSLHRNRRPVVDVGTHPRGVTAVEWFGRKEIWVVGSNPDRVVRVQL